MPELTAEERAMWNDIVAVCRSGQVRLQVPRDELLAVNARLLALEKLAEVSIKLRDNFKAWEESAGTPDVAALVIENGRLYGEWLEALAALDKPS